MSLFGPPQMQGGEPEAVAAEPAESQRDTVPWVPPLHADLWSGSVPDDQDGGPPSQPTPPEQWGPTDEELVAAMEEFEKQQLE